jgi:hypothetical protein
MKQLFGEQEERDLTDRGGLGGNRFEPHASGVGALSIERTRLFIPSLGKLTPQEMIDGLADRGPDKYLGHKPYSDYSYFVPRPDDRAIAGLPTHDIGIGRFLSLGLSNWGPDNGTVVVTGRGADPDTGLPWTRLSTVDTTRGDNATGSHVVSGSRIFWFEPNPDGEGYYLNSMGLSRMLTLQSAAAERVMEGLENLKDWAARSKTMESNTSSGGPQNQNWRYMMEGAAELILKSGGEVEPLFTMKRWDFQGYQPNQRLPAPTVGSWSFAVPSWQQWR